MPAPRTCLRAVLACATAVAAGLTVTAGGAAAAVPNHGAAAAVPNHAAAAAVPGYGATAAPGATAAENPAAPSAPVGGSAGCGTAAPQQPGTTVVRTVTSGGLQRAARVHVPANYDPARPTPVVLAFHGRGAGAEKTENFTGLSSQPAVVAYPEGVRGADDRQAWQGAPYSAPGVDDVAFTRTLLDDLESDLCLDRQRVFATGISNGGGFTEILGCRMADRIASVAAVAGAYYRKGEPACAPGRAVPALFVHGTADSTIPYGGNASRGLPPIPDKVAEWVRRDGCTPRPATRRTEPDVTTSTYTGCTAGATVEHVAVDGGGHTWPGATSYSGEGRTTQTVRATDLVARFFGLR
ncbi:CE1 family esterase [Pseudonocardia phyllosphaerae]|uniref:alpha/beta hydrolase family esterase n=1 Tax=Pseudonocardia phyllosphaerae TaxID=3390502 RepID=UPI00397882CB